MHSRRARPVVLMVVTVLVGLVLAAPAIASTAPGLLGTLAVGDALWAVVARNLVYFVALPGGVLIGGFAGIRRFLDADTNVDPTRLGTIDAAGGALLLVGTVVSTETPDQCCSETPFSVASAGPLSSRSAYPSPPPWFVVA